MSGIAKKPLKEKWSMYAVVLYVSLLAQTGATSLLLALYTESPSTTGLVLFIACLTLMLSTAFKFWEERTKDEK